MADAIQAKELYLADFARFEDQLDGQRHSSLHSVRKAAIARFAELGFPTTRDEEWKYTSVTPITRVPFQPAAEARLDAGAAAARQPPA